MIGLIITLYFLIGCVWIFLTRTKYQADADKLATENEIDGTAALIIILAFKVIVWPTTLTTKAG